ncbi:MAG: response regulator [Lachnospiraceae bacterium]|nr:response regulator [Lachnospiraceae bacterium]
MRLDNSVRKLITDRSRSLRERVFVVLTLAATAVMGLAIIGDLLYVDNRVEILTLVIAFFVVHVITIIGVRTKKTDVAAKILSFGLIVVILPIVFLFGGGSEGAVVPWLIFAYLYIGLMLPGRWRITALIIHTIIVAAMFTIGYYYPELNDVHTRRVKSIDVALAVVEVGYICFVMTWFQNRVFKQENARVKEETKKVEELSQSQNRFFSNMSHEIRTPINSIMGLNEIILRNPDATDEIRKDSRNIQTAGRMLLALINDLLDFSRIEAGRMEIVPVDYNVAKLMSEIANMMWAPAAEKGLDLNVTVDHSVPRILHGDEVRIKQILVNLLNNAVKYTEEGSVTLRVGYEKTDDENIRLIFRVTDTGMGIRQEVIPYLFDAFTRADEEKNAGIEGTGLGLSIVKQLTDLMKGDVGVDSEYSKGTTFTVTLLQKVIDPDPTGEFDISGDAGEAYADGHFVGFSAASAAVLIVDDNRMNLEVEKKLLKDTEISTDTVLSGEEALKLTMEKAYDVILMDHMMPGMDGIECMKRIRQQDNGRNLKTPVIVLTANAGSKDRELYAKCGFDGYLVKPVSGSQLEEVMRTHLPASKITVKQTTAVKTKTEKNIPEKIIPGIDRSEGIKNCGSAEAFETMLGMFADLAKESCDEIDSYYKEGNWNAYAAKVHALKSSAQIIGAGKLAGEAFALETAAKDNDIEYIRNNHSAVMKHLMQYETMDTGHEGKRGVVPDRFIVESIFEALLEAEKDNDDETIRDILEEAEGYSFSYEDEEKLEKWRKHHG